MNFQSSSPGPTETCHFVRKILWENFTSIEGCFRRKLPVSKPKKNVVRDKILYLGHRRFHSPNISQHREFSHWYGPPPSGKPPTLVNAHVVSYDWSLTRWICSYFNLPTSARSAIIVISFVLVHIISIRLVILTLFPPHFHSSNRCVSGFCYIYFVDLCANTQNEKQNFQYEQNVDKHLPEWFGTFTRA